MSASFSGRASGMTLIELLVVLAIISVVLSVTGLALGRRQEPTVTTRDAALAAARLAAARSGTAVQILLPAVDSAHVPVTVLVLPDGRVIGENVDLFTGEPRDP